MRDIIQIKVCRHTSKSNNGSDMQQLTQLQSTPNNTISASKFNSRIRPHTNRFNLSDDKMAFSAKHYFLLWSAG